jgi:predicted 2-oxoglutarate/Fe(II)-dependent dioxygenase YbiX
MSKRLQVLLDEPEIREIQRAARAKRMTVAEWVRGALREARRKEPLGDVGDKIAAIRRAARYSFPAPDIEQMLAEIEKGYGAGSSEEP